jgi:hypothetical protein
LAKNAAKLVDKGFAAYVPQAVNNGRTPRTATRLPKSLAVKSEYPFTFARCSARYLDKTRPFPDANASSVNCGNDVNKGRT